MTHGVFCLFVFGKTYKIGHKTIQEIERSRSVGFQAYLVFITIKIIHCLVVLTVMAFPLKTLLRVNIVTPINKCDKNGAKTTEK